MEQEKLKASLYPKKTVVLLGENVQLRCETSTGATYHWILNGTRLESDQYRVMNPLGILTIYGLAEEDLGEYVCVAESEAGFSASHALVDAGGKKLVKRWEEICFGSVSRGSCATIVSECSKK